MAARQPTFISDFSVTCSRATQVNGFISWFDTWFTPTGRPFPSGGRTEMSGGEELPDLPVCESEVPKEQDIRGLDVKGSSIVDTTTDEQGGETVSFTTGPHGLETHWKQTLFVLKEPVDVVEGE